MFSSHFHACGRTLAAIPRRFVLASLLALLMSCGGGGGGDDNDDGGGGGGGLAISLDRNSVSWSHYPSDAPTQQTITATGRGTYEGTLYAAIVVENNGTVNAIDERAISLTISGTQAVATIKPVATLAAGTYTGRLVFLACSDPACNNRIGGTPLPVSFTVNVLAPVRAQPDSLARTVTSGTSVTEDFVVTPGQNETSVVMGAATSSFVQITNASAGGFRVTLPSLPAGTYTASIPLTGSQGSRSSIPITYTVLPPAGGERALAVEPTKIEFPNVTGEIALAQSLQVTEASWRPGLREPVIQYVTGENWLQFTRSASGYELVADTTNLSAGTYDARFIVGSNPLPEGIPEPRETQREVSVALTVGPGLIKPADVSHEINSNTTLAGLSGTVPINLIGGPATRWTAASNANWLSVSPGGITGSDLRYTIDRAWLASVPNFVEQGAKVTVSAQGTVLTPVTFSIRVTPRFAEVIGVGARVQLAGQSTTLVVTGRGFDSLSDPASRVVVAGVMASSVEKPFTDSKLLATFDSLSPGTHEVAVTNALNIATPTRSVVAMPSPNHGYATAASGAKLDMLIPDYERNTFYAVGRAAGKLFRFRFDGSGWNVFSPDITGVDNVGVLHNGDVIVMRLPGTLAILDRETLTEKSSLDLGCAAAHGITDAGIPVSLDGRVWVAKSDPANCNTRFRAGRLGIFDPATETFSLLPVPEDGLLLRDFMNGPDMMMSRNGERLVIHQDNGQPPRDGRPFAPLVYLDASEPILTPTRLDAPHWFITAAVSDNGNRVVLDMDRVLNGRFEVVGRIVIPRYSADPDDTAISGVAALSPDGKRAYVLAYRRLDLNQPSTSFRPRVFVVNTDREVGENSMHPLGYFELDDYPSCVSDTQACEAHPPAVTSLDGRTLYFAGSNRFVVAPVPNEDELIPPNAVSAPQAAAPMVTKPWRWPAVTR